MWNNGSAAPQQQPGPRAFTLRQLADNIGRAIYASPALQNVWVAAEMSDLRFVGGHCYMELVEKDAAGQDQAKIRANIWASTLVHVRQKFYQATGRDLGSGLKVMVRGTVQYHPKFGISFNILDVDPSYTLGDIERLRREILERLHREGVLQLNKSRILPATPQRVAVISAAGAAGYGDFINQLDSNGPGFVFYTKLFPATMQGVNTAPSVMQALSKVEMTLDLWDCVVIVRGGGATTDMTGFDSYDLARRVATFPIPVIVGIGHERDRNVLDEIACVRCKTPTAVGAFLVDRLTNAYARTQQCVKSIMDYASARVSGENTRLAHLMAAIPAAAGSAVELARERLRSASAELPLLASAATSAARADLLRTADAIGNAATSLTSSERQKLNARGETLGMYSLNVLAKNRDRLEAAGELLQVLDPANTLKRGYSVTRVDGHAVTDASVLAPGTVIETRLYSGTVTSTVSETDK